MKRVLIAACAAFALSACATGPGYGYIGGDVGYNAYYDDAYGPYYDGYWGRDGEFWYSSGRGAPYQRDRSQHFRRTAGESTGAFSNPASPGLGGPGTGSGGHAFHGVHGRGGIHRH